MASPRLSIIKHLYLTIVTIVVLAMMLISAGYLIHTALYAYVFTGDEISKGYPPAPYIVDDGSKLSASVVCDETCELSENQQLEIRDWMTIYTEWKAETPERIDRNGLVVALSFFIVAVPLFLIHFRMLRKEHKEADKEGTGTATFYSYYYIVALGTLIAAVVYGALLIYTTLSTWVIPDTQTNRDEIYREIPISQSTISSIESCGEVCGFSEGELDIVADYAKDIENADEYYLDQSAWQNRFSVNIAGLLVTIPFFFYHWTIIRKKPKKETTD